MCYTVKVIKHITIPREDMHAFVYCVTNEGTVSTLL